MELLPVNCNHCGAPLEVPESARFITCGHCGSRLEVRRTENVVYTEVLEQLQQRTEQIADEVETLRVQNELARLDRDWETERERYMVRGKHGARHEPDSPALLIGGVAGLFVCGLMFVMMLGSGNSAGFAIVPAGMAVAIVVGMIHRAGKAKEYERRRRNYQRQRATLLAKIDRGDSHE